MTYKYSKLTFLLIYINFIASCTSQTKLYDISPPIVEYLGYYQSDILLSFNEPVISAKILSKNNNPFILDIHFPVANLFLDPRIFYKSGDNFKLEFSDFNGNLTNTTLITPQINLNPAKFKIIDINVKYTKKNKQSITIKSLNSGTTKGYKLSFFSRNKIYNFEIQNSKIKKDTKYLIYLDYDKNYKPNILQLNHPLITMQTNHRLSKTSSMIFITNHRQQLEDYIFYYNPKHKTKNQIYSSKSFKKRSEIIKKQYQIDIKLKQL